MHTNHFFKVHILIFKLVDEKNLNIYKDITFYQILLSLLKGGARDLQCSLPFNWDLITLHLLRIITHTGFSDLS